MAEFTREDVAVGDTVHLIQRHGDVSENHIKGVVLSNGIAVLVADAANPDTYRWSGYWDGNIEIVSVEKPKRELVTGGIYEVTAEGSGELRLRRRVVGGWGWRGEIDCDDAAYHDGEQSDEVIGRRVLLVDHPSERPGVAYDDLVTEAITREQAE